MEFLTELFSQTAVNIATTIKNLIIPALAFLMIAIVFKRDTWRADIKRAIPETGINVKLMLFNLAITMPLIGLVVTFLGNMILSSGVHLIDPRAWAQVPTVLLLVITVFIGDFIAYWRHRLEHTPLFWPSHAVHHSDTEMTWFTNYRFHPINVVTTVIIGMLSLLLIGLPVDAILTAALFRHYYGDFIHADLPWTYGRMGKIFVSPAMHRWHHSAETVAHDKNFAGVFCLFDRAFGTYYLPGVQTGRLGVTDDIAPTFWAQLKFAFEKRAYGRFVRSLRRPGVRAR